MKGLILSGGHGTRLRPLTFTGNKHMLPIANKPMLNYGFQHLINAGITEIGIVLGPLKEGVIEEFGDGSKYGVNITYIEQPEPKGLAHAIMVSRAFLEDESFVMYLGDNLLKQGVSSQLKLFNEKECDFVGAITQVDNPSSYGVVVMNNGQAERVVEKPKEFISDLALIGVYVFSNRVFEALNHIKPSWRGEYEITDTVQWLIDNGAKVEMQRVEGWWKDTGKPEDLLIANRLVLNDLESHISSDIEGTLIIDNDVNIGENVKIHSNTKIVGPTIIGEGCIIGPNAIIGPYASIGNNTKILNSEIKNSIVMEGAIIDCNRKISDSLLGRNIEILCGNKNANKYLKLILGDQAKIQL